MSETFPNWHGTTILAVRKNGSTVIAGDGQVSMGPTIVKGNAKKVRLLAGGNVAAGFAGATADDFTLTGNGDVLEPEDGLIAIGSGGNFALAAARALIEIPDLTAEEVARRAMKIAGDICVYTNYNVIVETIS
jgi:ATP-dependent HslUV protease subunit HslV